MFPPHLTHGCHQLGQGTEGHLVKQLPSSILDRPNPNLLRIGNLPVGLPVQDHFQGFREGGIMADF
jgi:hypothetical protein